VPQRIDRKFLYGLTRYEQGITREKAGWSKFQYDSRLPLKSTDKAG